MIRHDYTVEEIQAIHDLPIPELVFRAQVVHREFHRPNEVQLCTLLSVKTGGCIEDCSYCAQSVHYKTGVRPTPLMDVEAVLQKARCAKQAGATRFCMGSAGREAKDGTGFERVLDMIREVRALGMEACVTLGMLTDEQAERLAAAGLTTYNHNLDTSREYYRSVTRTRTFDERLETLHRVRKAGIGICSGGIIGMGESIRDRCSMLQTLATLDPHPESVPINGLVPNPGTPMAERPPIDPLEMVRMIATARIIMPRARVRLSAGRSTLSREAQVLCFAAGANSIFFGEKLLTTGNTGEDADRLLLRDAGLTPATSTH